jgi:hypothetical protein
VHPAKDLENCVSFPVAPEYSGKMGLCGSKPSFALALLLRFTDFYKQFFPSIYTTADGLPTD